MAIDTTFVDATSAYRNALRGLESAGAGFPDRVRHDAPPTSFSDILRNVSNDVVATQREAETLSVKAVTGEASLIDVVGALNNAELTLNSVVAIRDRVIAAYQEIIRMPI